MNLKPYQFKYRALPAHLCEDKRHDDRLQNTHISYDFSPHTSTGTQALQRGL